MQYLWEALLCSMEERKTAGIQQKGRESSRIHQNTLEAPRAFLLQEIKTHPQQTFSPQNSFTQNSCYC